MSDEKIKVECHLKTKGTDEVEDKVSDDLDVPDPELAVGKQIIKNIMEKDVENDD